jgi:cytochrome c oxidase subunit 4
MTEHALEDATHEDTAGHAPFGIAKYVYVFLALCLLTTMSFWTSGYLDFLIRWPFPGDVGVSRAFMMAVSCTKAMLVILFFMHVKYEANWKYVLTIPAGIMSIFLMLMLVPDVGLRLHHASEERLLHMAVPTKITAADTSDVEPANPPPDRAPPTTTPTTAPTATPTAQ